MKTKRKKVQREWLENQLFKYQRRIERLMEEAFHIRQAIQLIDTQLATPEPEKVDISTELLDAAIQPKVEG